MKLVSRAACVVCLFGAVGCGSTPPAKNTVKEIDVPDDKLAFVEKALKDAKVEGKVIQAILYEGAYQVMVQPPTDEKSSSATGGGDTVGGVSMARPPASYIVSMDGKVKKGL